MVQAIVLGAGMVGVTTALALRDRGFDVTLFDRRPPGQETSFGNAGIIQSESVEPYAMPRSLKDLFNIATGRSNDVYYTFRELPAHVSTLLKYWWYSEAGRHRAIAVNYARLIGRATGTHKPLIERAGAGNLIVQNGYRTLYRSQRALEEGIAKAERIRTAFGTVFRVTDAEETRREEPGFIDAGAGAIHWLDPWTVSDPGGLVSAYADLYRREGGVFIEATVDGIDRVNNLWRIRAGSEVHEAEHLVIALGVWSGALLDRFGLNFPMVLKRGYHAHYASPVALSTTTMDTANGYVMAPMRAGTRITTGAHLTQPGQPPVYRQLERAEQAARELIDLGTRVEDVPWSGTRPCMPDMLPVIGPVKDQPGLWLNFGHGHQGFTLGPASAEMLAAMIEGHVPEVDPAPFSAERYRR